MSADPENSTNRKNIQAVYIGDDEKYCDNLIEKFKTVSTIPVICNKIIHGDSINIYDVFKKLIVRNIDVLYIDLTKFSEESLQLALTLNRNNLTKDMLIVALLDHQASEDDIKKTIIGGIKLTYIKSSELNDVAYGPIAMVEDTVVVEPQYATAQVDTELNISDFARIGSISVDKLVMEYSNTIAKNTEFSLQTNFLKLKMPSSQVKVINEMDSDFYYEFDHKYELSYSYMDEEHFQEDGADKDEQIDHVKRAYYKWIMEAIDDSKPKYNKLLIVNKSLDGFTEPDQHPFVIRYQPFLRKPAMEIKKIRPNILGYKLEKSKKEIEDELSKQAEADTAAGKVKRDARIKSVDRDEKLLVEIEKEISSGDPAAPKSIEAAKEKKKKLEDKMAEDDKKDEERLQQIEEKKKMEEALQELQLPLLKQYHNDKEVLGEIIKGINESDDYEPIIIVFNCLDMSSEDLKAKYKYEKIIGYTTDIDSKMLIEMAGTQDTKDREDMKQVPPIKLGLKDVPNHTRFFSKRDINSVAEICVPAVLLTMTEHDLTFTCTAAISPGNVFKLVLSLDSDEEGDEAEEVVCFMTVASTTAEGAFRGLIHSLNVSGKKSLRQFINSIFFREKKEKKKLELEEFKKKNEEKEKEAKEKEKLEQEKVEKEKLEKLEQEKADNLEKEEKKKK